MTTRQTGREPERSRNELFRCYADGNRRYTLGLLDGRVSATSVSDLAAHLAARAGEKSLLSVTDAEHRRQLTDLRHRHLPAMADAGLIEYDREAAAVTARFEDVDELGLDEVPADDDLDALFRALADERRRTTLSVLSEQRHPIRLETLARDVAAREAGEPERAVSGAAVDRVRVSLVHSHLPLLREAGLVTADDAGRLSYEGHPALRARWLRPDFERDSRESGVRTVEGRESVVACGQSLFERADEELFLMITTTGLLEEGCLARLEDAIDRGVDVSLGTRDPTVREVVRERLPGAVIWEPQSDWLTLPPERDAIGRLVLADREAALVGTLGRAREDERDETAIAGEGADNGLVVLLCEMLGPRLDHLDAQSEDFLSRLSP